MESCPSQDTVVFSVHCRMQPHVLPQLASEQPLSVLWKKSWNLSGKKALPHPPDLVSACQAHHLRFSQGQAVPWSPGLCINFVQHPHIPLLSSLLGSSVSLSCPSQQHPVLDSSGLSHLLLHHFHLDSLGVTTGLEGQLKLFRAPNRIENTCGSHQRTGWVWLGGCWDYPAALMNKKPERGSSPRG